MVCYRLLFIRIQVHALVCINVCHRSNESAVYKYLYYVCQQPVAMTQVACYAPSKTGIFLMRQSWCFYIVFQHRI